MSKIFLGIGSNKGDRKVFLEKAIFLISQIIGKISITSAIYETVPWGYKSKCLFLNIALVAETELNIDEVLVGIIEIETILGRKREKKDYEDRTIDIDILMFDDMVIETEKLSVPHPLMHKRRFVLMPLAEISGETIHPVFLKTIDQLLLECCDENHVKRLNLPESKNPVL